MATQIFDQIGLYRDRFDEDGRSGYLMLDILFKAADFLEKYKDFKLYIHEMQVERVEFGGPWDPLNPPSMIKVHTTINAPSGQPAPWDRTMAEVHFLFSDTQFIPGVRPEDKSNETLMKVKDKVDPEMFAALRVAEIICEQYRTNIRSYISPSPWAYAQADIMSTATAMHDQSYSGCWINDGKQFVKVKW